jgi:hypothetical protein
MRVKLYIGIALFVCLLLVAFSVDAQITRSIKPINVIKPVEQNNTTNQAIGKIKPIREQGAAGQTGTSQAGTISQIGGIHPARTTTVINFDDLVTGGWGTGGPILVTNQYTSKGITFSGSRAINYSEGIPIPGFAHSGNIALEACYGAEFCTDPLEMVFNKPVSFVKVWVGIDTQSTAKQTYSVKLNALDPTGQQVAYQYVSLNANAGPVPIQTPIQVSGSNIARATVSLASFSYNNGLDIDDVEFSSEPATMAPVRYE